MMLLYNKPIFDYKKMNDYITGHGIKKAFIAEKANINKGSLRLILTGRQRCTADQYISICRALGKSTEEFISEGE
ncbi:helix-turn-helix transcriptional regulator [uncultured Dubosiella sp.]|uniref:helix-turn-helix domain-containing protein n=1 Tax=uncultured Dubosiella sp. TaxID=1937011 RepID=UPI00272FA90E|nr:helix-turn-helix transcriptional regulator [uncultured Dubosiella sp.]